MITEWIGYREGAFCADSIGYKAIQKNGDNYIITQSAIYNVHPRVIACGGAGAYGPDAERIEYAPGVYPIRWKLDHLEIKHLIED